METLADALPKEMARVRKVLDHYKEIGPAGMFGAEILGVDACGKEQQGVQATGEVAVEALPVVFEMVFGKIILHRGELVFRQGRAEGVAGEYVPARQFGIRIQPGVKLKCRGVFDQVVHDVFRIIVGLILSLQRCLS